VGVDVERIDPAVDREAIGALAFDPSTARRLAGASVCSFFAHWTRLEALGKCRGTGLREQMAFDPRAGEVVVDIDAGPGTQPPWRWRPDPSGSNC
jgi:phosphopantetheinyl transferase